MPFTQEQYIEMVVRFVRDGDLTEVSDDFQDQLEGASDESEKADLAKTILHAMPVLEKTRCYAAIKEALTVAYSTIQDDASHKAEFERRYWMLKESQDKFFGSETNRILRLHGFFDRSGKPPKPDNGLPKSINFDAKRRIKNHRERFRKFTENAHPNVAAFAGSTYFTNAPYAQGGPQPTHLLDALEIVEITTEAFSKEYAIAVADGCGGHRVGERQDKAIAKAATVAAKHATRMLSAFNDSDELLINMRKVVRAIADAIWQVTKEERTTISAVRTFQQLDGRMRIVGFGIGDSLIMGYDPATKQMKNLVPARSSVGSVLGGAFNFPALYNEGQADDQQIGVTEGDLQIIDEIVPAGTILLAMTDGGFKPLPHVSYDPSPELSQKEIQYQDVCLDPRNPAQVFGNSTTFSAIFSALSNTVVTNTESFRQQKVAAAEKAQKEMASAEFTAAVSFQEAIARVINLPDAQFPLLLLLANLDELFCSARITNPIHKQSIQTLFFPEKDGGSSSNPSISREDAMQKLRDNNEELKKTITDAESAARIYGGDDLVIGAVVVGQALPRARCVML